MKSDGVSQNRALLRGALLMRGESAVASVGIAAAVILLVALGAFGYWVFHSQRTALTEARQRQLETVAEFLAETTPELLAADRLTTVRRMLMDAADRHDLTVCRIVLPTGEIIADADASQITATVSAASWGAEPPSAAPVVQQHNDTWSAAYPLHVLDRGGATLQLAATVNPQADMLGQAQTGAALIAVAAFVALLMTYRHFRTRLAGMGVIREALLALQNGETAASALAVSDDLGNEAVAWNRILQEQKALRQQAMLHRTTEAQSPVADANDLVSGCDAVSHGLMLVDDGGRVRYANNAAGVYLQANREAMQGRPVKDFISDEEVARLIVEAAAGKLRRRATRETSRGEGNAAGVLRYSVHPVRRGDGGVAMVVVEDVTQQRVAEEASHEFVAHATHELRTPLTNIRLYLETAQDEGASDPKVRAQCLNVINQETHRLERLVGDMLSVAEIEAGALQITHDDVKFDALINDIRAHYEAQAAEKQISLTFNMPPKLPIVQGDRDKLMLAVQNLVGNALKYTPQNGKVSVQVEASEGELVLEVADNGIGIAPEDAKRIFEKFYRAQDRRISGITGSGLGLALAREIARLHSGDVTVDSKLDHGSTFTLTLPARTEESTATEQTGGATSA